MNRIHFRLGALALASLAMTACDSDKNTEPTASDAKIAVVSTNEDGGGYVAGFSSVPTGDLDLVSTQGARQITAGWGSGGMFEGRNLYMLANYDGAAGLKKYTINGDGSVTAAGTLGGAVHAVIASATKGFYADPVRGNMQVQVFNPATMERTGSIDLSSLSKADSLEQAGQQMLAVRDGKLFVGLVFGRSYGGMAISDRDTAFLAVIDIATEKLLKVTTLEDTYSVGYPADMVWSFQGDDGHLYMAVPFRDWWNPDGNRSGKLVRLKKGSDEFDRDWSIDMRQYKEHIALMGGAVRNGKFYTSIVRDGLDASWSQFTTDSWDLVSIDLATKAMTVIKGVPKHRFNAHTPIHFVDGQMYVLVVSDAYNGFYRVEGDSAVPAFRIRAGGQPLHLQELD